MAAQTRTIVLIVGALFALCVRANAQPGKPKEPIPAGTKKKLPDEKDKKEVKDPPPLTAAEPFSTLGRLQLAARPLPRAPEMLGDQPPRRIVGIPGARGVAGPGGGPAGAVALPGNRGYKVSDNGSPRPQDRVYFTFNYFNDLDGAVNRALGADLRNAHVFRETLGLEKTFLDGWASIDVRVPLNTYSADSTRADLNRTSTAFGDLSAALRVAVWRDEELDNWVTLGLAVTAPTGPRGLAGVDVPGAPHSTVLQPFAAVLWNYGDWYVQGFSALDIPTDTADTTLWYNDLGVGYFLYRSTDLDRLVSSFGPALEVHVTTPLDHRGDLGASDIVNLSAVGNLEFTRGGRLSAGVVTPVTGPRPFAVEAIVQFRIPF